MRKSIWLFAASFAIAATSGCDGAGAMSNGSEKSEQTNADHAAAPPQKSAAARAAALSVNGTIPYYVASAPPAISESRLLKTIDTATRIWFAVLGTNSQGNLNSLFYKTESLEEAKVVFRYEDTDHWSDWDVRDEGEKVVFVMHRSVRQNTVVWANQPFLYYSIANFIGVDLLGKNVSANPSSLTWRPGRLSGVTDFPHLPSQEDGAQVSDPYKGGRPLFTKMMGPNLNGSEIVLGWDSARKYEKIGYGIAFRGRVFPLSAQENQYSLGNVKGYWRRTNPKIGYYPGIAVNLVKYGACRDAGYYRDVSWPDDFRAVWFATLNLDSYYPGLEKSEITPIYSANFNQGMGYQIVYDVPRGTGCYAEAGGLQTGRGLPQ